MQFETFTSIEYSWGSSKPYRSTLAIPTVDDEDNRYLVSRLNLVTDGMNVGWVDRCPVHDARIDVVVEDDDPRNSNPPIMIDAEMEEERDEGRHRSTEMTTDFERLHRATDHLLEELQTRMDEAYQNDQKLRFVELDDRRVRLNDFQEYLRLHQQFGSTGDT